MKTNVNGTAAKTMTLKGEFLIGALILLLISASALVMINANALFIDAGVFIVVGCITCVVRNRR
jgi:hypothetical protein